MNNSNKFITLILLVFLFNQLEIKSDLVVYPLGNRRELFIDDFLIEHKNNVSLQLCNPIPAEKVLEFDKPWEGKFCGYVTILYDNDVFRTYYRGLTESRADGSPLEVTCYAESTDGIHFTKPNLGIHEVMGTLENNVILANLPPFSHNFAPFIDENPDRRNIDRYKAIAGTFDSGLYVFTSTDGIHWKKLFDSPIIKGNSFALDSQNNAFWSLTENRYVLYFRTWNGPNSEFRWISRTTSIDLLHWNPPQTVERGKAPWEHIYTNQIMPYFRAPHIYISLGARFVPNCNAITDGEKSKLQIDPNYANDCSDVILMSSRGGNAVTRTFLEAFIKPEIGPENWVSRTNYPVRGIIPAGEHQMAIYVQKKYAQPKGYIQRYLLRLDGFSCLKAGYSQGNVTTKPITFNGQHLYINYATSAVGWIKIELRNVNNEPIDDFSFEKCKLIKGNRIDDRVQWDTQKSLSDLAGIPIRISFEMKDAELYSFQFR